jgi:ribosomal protein S10
MIFSNLSQREKRLFYLTAGLIASLFIYRFVINPIVVNWMGLDKRIGAGGLKLEKSQKILNLKGRIQRDYERYASSVKMSGSEEEEMAKFLTEIESLARSSSVHISGIKPLPIKKVDFYKKYVVELEAEGDIKQVSKFIYDIQNSQQLLKIDKFSLGTKGAGTNLLKCNILVSKVLIP